MHVNHSFRTLKFRDGMREYFEDRLSVQMLNGEEVTSNTLGAAFIYVQRGSVVIKNRFHLTKGMYALINTGNIEGYSPCTKAMIVRDRGYHGMTMFGGPIEREGRLRYIDGCTDSLLITPVKMGDPCLNHLHFPAKVKQTMHTHPSIRIGMVVRGSGICHTPFGSEPLRTGTVFMILPENGYTAFSEDGTLHKVGMHCFETTDDEMDIIAFHPDSDWGATDDFHPMRAQTILAEAAE